MKYKCVFTDLDRTFLNGNGRVSEYSKSVIESLIARGIDFVPCTGRSFHSLPEDIFSIKGIRNAVTSNGVSIDDLQLRKSVDLLCVPPEIPLELSEFLKSEDVFLEFFVEGQGYTPKKYYDAPEEFDSCTFNSAYIKASRIPVVDMDSFLRENCGRIGSIDVIAHPCDAGRIHAALRKSFPDVYMTFSEKFLVEISNINCGKHRGLERWCAMKGISPEEVIAFGDGNNDIEMMRAAGLSVAVANASEECREAADRMCLSNEEDGVAHELEKIFGLNEF